jgi:hypothetical protein
MHHRAKVPRCQGAKVINGPEVKLAHEKQLQLQASESTTSGSEALGSAAFCDSTELVKVGSSRIPPETCEHGFYLASLVTAAKVHSPSFG